MHLTQVCLNIFVIFDFLITPLDNSKWLKSLIILVSFIIIFIISIYNILFITSSLSISVFLIGVCSNSIFCILIFLIAFFTQKLKFIGVPYKSEKLSNICKHLNISAFYFVFTRIFEAGLIFVIFFCQDDTGISYRQIKNLSSATELKGMVFYFGYLYMLLQNEILAGLIVLDSRFLGYLEITSSNSLEDLDESILTFKDEDTNLANQNNNRSRNSNSNQTPFLKDNMTSRDTIDEIEGRQRQTMRLQKLVGSKIPPHLIKLDHSTRYTRVGGLGHISFGLYKELDCKMRIVTCKKLNSYLLKEIPIELEKFKYVSGSIIEFPYCIIHETDKLIFLSEANPDMNTLHSVIIEQKIILGDKIKMKILRGVANGLLWLHESKHRIVHGHICPKNILVLFFNVLMFLG